MKSFNLGFFPTMFSGVTKHVGKSGTKWGKKSILNISGQTHTLGNRIPRTTRVGYPTVVSSILCQNRAFSRVLVIFSTLKAKIFPTYQNQHFSFVGENW